MLELEDPRLWVALAFILFVALTYRKVSTILFASLDSRSLKIKMELDQARSLREEAEALLADYKRKQGEYLKEAEQILLDAKRDAESLNQQAAGELRIALDDRMNSAIDKIAQEEAKAITDVRNHVVDIALAAARAVIIEYAGSMPKDDSIKLALADIERKIH